MILSEQSPDQFVSQGAADIMRQVLRWRIKPTTTNRLAIPEPFRPTPLQYHQGINHSLVIDLINWPTLRDQLIMHSQHDDIDHIVGDIVMNTVIDIDQFQMSLGVLDLFHNKVLPKTDPDSPPETKHYAHTTSIMGPREAAAQRISREITSRMATVDVNDVQSMFDGYNPPRRQPKASKHPLAEKIGIDRFLNWKLSQDFCQKYPFLDCSSREYHITGQSKRMLILIVAASFPTRTCSSVLA